MNKKQFSKILHCTSRYWDMVLNAQRSLSYDKAVIASSTLDTSLGLWMDRDAKPSERQNAWQAFQVKMNGDK
jgi:plasmid maintenance system antidote protein VapI